MKLKYKLLVDYNLKSFKFESPSDRSSEQSFLLPACSCNVNTPMLATRAVTLFTSISFVQVLKGNEDGSMERIFVEITTQVSLQPQYILDKIII